MKKCHQPQIRFRKKTILVFNSQFPYRAFSSRPRAHQVGNKSREPGDPGRFPPTAGAVARRGPWELPGRGCWTAVPSPNASNRKPKFLQIGIGTDSDGRRPEDQPPNKHVSSRLPESCVRRETGYESRGAESVRRSEMPQTHCLHGTQAPGYRAALALALPATKKVYKKSLTIKKDTRFWLLFKKLYYLNNALGERHV